MAKEQRPEAPQGMRFDWRVLGGRSLPAWQARPGAVALGPVTSLDVSQTSSRFFLIRALLTVLRSRFLILARFAVQRGLAFSKILRFDCLLFNGCSPNFSLPFCVGS